MRGLEIWLALAALAGCGGGHGGQAAGNGPDGGSDAGGTPMPPALGVQLDRMGRPGVGEFLIGTLGDAGAADRRTAYQQASDPTTWLTTTLATNVTVSSELQGNLALYDSIDTGQGVGTTTLVGCTNAFDYTTPATGTSYAALATLLADDQIYLDSAKTSCSQYLALEIEQVGHTVLHSTCGGRILSYDAIDTLLSLVMSGLSGLTFDSNALLVPLDHSAATVHADITDTFPFLGPPNP
jgi:hypothetical protein